MIEKDDSVIVGELPDAEMEGLDYLDEGMAESEEKDSYVEDKETKSKKDADDIDESDDDIDDDEDIDEIDDDIDEDVEDAEDEVEESDTKQKQINVSALRGKELSNKAYQESAKALESLSEEFEYLDDLEPPKKPVKDEYGEVDEEDMAEYRAELAVYKRDMARNKKKAEMLQSKMRKVALKAQDAFLKDFPEAVDNGFEQFVASKRLRYLSWTTGERSLYSLYREHLENLDLLDDAKKVKNMKKQGVKIKPTSHKKGDATKTKGGNGFSSKYKYANMPMFKDFVKEKRGKVSDISKRRLTDKELDDLCKQEYKLMKGYSIV